MISFELIGLPETYNKMNRKHWGYKSNHNKKWQMLVEQVLFFKKLIPPKPYAKARVLYVRYSSVEPDYDGLVSSFKIIQDSLVRCGVVENDRQSNLQAKYEWRKIGQGHGKIVVNLEEIPS